MAHSWSGWADTMIVGKGTAAGTHALLLKALASTGCPTWQARRDASPRSPIVVWCYTSDRGSDQVLFRALCRAEASADCAMIFVDADCLAHASHLVVKSGLRLTDAFLESRGKPYRFYGTVAKATTLWRDNVRAMYTFIANNASASDAERLAGSLPSKCIAGRWGSVQNAEQRLLAFGRDLLHAAFMSLRTRREEHKRRDNGRPNMDEESVDEMAQFSAKIGRWARETTTAFVDPLWWPVLQTMNLVHQPVTHHLNFLESMADMGSIAALVDGKAETLLNEWEALLDADLELAGLTNDEVGALSTRATRMRAFWSFCMPEVVFSVGEARETQSVPREARAMPREWPGHICHVIKLCMSRTYRACCMLNRGSGYVRVQDAAGSSPCRSLCSARVWSVARVPAPLTSVGQIEPHCRLPSPACCGHGDLARKPLRGHQWTEAACPLSRGNLHCITAGDLCHGFVEPHLGSPLPLEGRCASLRGLQQPDQDHCSPLTRNQPTNLERTTAAQKGSWGLWLSLSQDFRMLLCLLCVLCFACPERLIDRWQKVG